MKIPVLCLCALAIAGCGKKEEPEEKPVVAVKVAKVEQADLPLTVKAPATIFPKEQANIAARLAAPIRELRVKKGDTIRAGEILALLENRDLVAQRQEAESALADAQANLQKITAGSIPTEIGRAEGQVSTTKAALDQAQKNLDRRQALFQQGAIPNRDLLQSQTELATAKANYEVAVRAFDLLKGQSREADINSARARVGQAEAKLANVRANLEFMQLRAPFNGTVTEQFQYPGDMAQPSSPVYTVMDLSTVSARAQVPEISARSLKQGQTCEFTSGDDPARFVPGRITVINRAVDPQRRTVEVWCFIERPPVALRAGVFGNVAIHTGEISQAVIVPVPAVQLQEGAPHGVAFVVDSHRIAHKRDVETGQISNGKIEIRKGVNAGEMVIIEGAYGLPDKTEVSLPGDKKESRKE
jgi:multidrug efflux pump subunit AcrA (membrane-fusion protein)